MTEPIAEQLGRVADPGTDGPFDEVRLVLLDSLIAANAEERLDHDAWETAFGAAARSLRLRVLAEAEKTIRDATLQSRYPARLSQRAQPSTEDAEVLLQRLLAEGMPLEKFDGFADDPVTRRARGAALERAWDGAVRVASAETARWRATASRIAAWRRPTTSLWIISAVLLVIALVLAGWIGGELPAPAWFRPVARLWWRLWP